MRRKPNSTGGARGFTIIELLVVIAIMGVVTTVTVPAVSQARDRGRSSAVVSEVASYETASALYAADNGGYPVPEGEDVDGSCFAAEDGVPQLCCIADAPCTYAGETRQPLSHGAFSPSPRGPLGGAMPRLPTLPPRQIAAGPLRYQGVFYSCDTAACQRPVVTWTQPSACTAGTTRNAVTGMCERQIDRTPVATAGQSETYCYNGQDDDGDGDLDCADADCAGRARCGAESSASFCDDAFDNDGDGAVDCGDDDCAVAGYCADWYCGDAYCDVGEICASDCAGENYCDDAADNDADGEADCDDNECLYVAYCGGQEGNCTDTLDNDSDDLADCADPDCALSPTCRPACIPDGPNETNCAINSGDEDCDGYANCGDSVDCGYLAFCGGQESDCTDGIDNDMDGSYDCNGGESDCAAVCQ